MTQQKHRAKKSLGQNFLADPTVRQRIVDACAFTLSDTVIEIGPGQGALTRLIAPLVKKLIIVETDRDLIPMLKTEFSQFSQVEIVHADFLKWEMRQVDGRVKVIGNIPYYISTPIIERLIEYKDKIDGVWMTVQFEFAQRLVAKANTDMYGSLSCFVQYHSKPSLLFKIKAGSFAPAPKVDSACVKLEFIEGQIRDQNKEKFLFQLIQGCFMQRRKTMVNALERFIPKEQAISILNDLSIASQRRPETLELSDFIKLAKFIQVTVNNDNYLL